MADGHPHPMFNNPLRNYLKLVIHKAKIKHQTPSHAYIAIALKLHQAATTNGIKLNKLQSGGVYYYVLTLPKYCGISEHQTICQVVLFSEVSIVLV